MGDSMERRSRERQTMVLNQFSRCQFKRRGGTGRLTTKRPISFENLLLSGKKPLPPAMSSLYKNISTALKENVNPEARSSQNVDDFWAVERQKRISAVARRKLTGAKETTQEVHEQPVEDRKARHARSRRAGGSRAVGAKAKKLDVFIDAELIADWDKENLEVEEEKPCTIESSKAFLSAQETALRASLKILNTMDDRVEAVPATSLPTHSQVNACKVNGEPKAQTPGPYDHATNGKSSSSLEDMDLSSGESPDSLIQNMMNPHDCTPDLASLVEMDWNTSCPPRAALENALNSQDTLRYQVQDAADSTLDTQRQTFCPSFREPPDKLRVDYLVADSRADRCSLGSTAQLRSQQFEQERRVNEDQGCISSLLMHCSLDKNVSCTNRDGTPLHDAQSQRTHLPTTSPTPPSNPFAVYMSRRQLLNETGELNQRKLAFGSCSPSSSPDFGEDCQNEDIPDVEVDWDRISYNDDPQDVDVPEREHEVANTDRPQDSPGKKSCSGSSFPHDGNAQKVQVVPYEGTETERYVRHVIESQESCSMHVNLQSESRRKSGSNFRTESLRGKSKVSSGVDGPRTSTVLAIKTMQADKAGLTTAANALFPEDKGAETPTVSNLHASAFKSDKRKQAEKGDFNAGKALSCEGPVKDTPRFDKPPFSPIKSLKTKQVEKTRLSSAAKSLRFEDQDNSSPRLCEAPVSASKSVNGTQAETTGLTIAAKALSFEDIEVEAALDAEEAELLMEERRAATEVGVCLPVDYEENTSKPSASQQCLPDDITSETQTCVDLESQPDEITADIQLCTNLESQADSVAAAKLQPEPRQQSQAKKPRRRKVQDRRSSLEGSENGCTWKGGQRRSQRIRVRPLEWWRGEKLLYGRVHDSLTSVIGIKQSSPGQYARGIKAPFVIESFVPSKYNELVRFAAI